ncbi:class I SAM-dependent methyltransferase [Janibacter sp. YIM B02568]|uniref:class I SAM-dependent methyltransferase n=1 Tax=Janibacter endophyticus TaxID=2806261 RepID=UPI00194F4D0C|nr:class I SAM-dependent methyltransferase [Janibacter endophyticus]MBM6545870.1 class I SAM-dependent methyltransferase [Janibacter endophyticus]
MTREPNAWEVRLREDPGHSAWYVERFRAMAREGRDLDGEARLVDAMLPRGSRVLDAGCGPGRVGGYLHRAGHTVVGVDYDPALISAAQEDHPGPTWLAGDLADLDLPAAGIADPFDLVVCAGNVMTFLAPSTRAEVLRRFAAHLAPEGRAVVGFGAGRDYPFARFREDAASAGLSEQLMLSSWDVRPLTEDSDFLVAVLGR